MRSLIMCLLLAQSTVDSNNSYSTNGNATSSGAVDVGLFVQASHLVQQHGTSATAQDERLKSKRSLENHMPPSRSLLPAQLRSHADLLTTTFDLIDEPHRQAGDKLAKWLSANYQAGKPLSVIVVCTGNSRRSILGSSMGNLAATYYGLGDIRFYSGGTSPSAFNKRTIATLEAVGFDITATGSKATPGEAETPNPILRVSWGQGLEAVEFSKHYADENNPQQDFAALMVCTEADEGCPVVQGAALRVSMPYQDPKAYDDSPFEAVKYAERRDDIGRLMLCVMCQVRRTLNH